MRYRILAAAAVSATIAVAACGNDNPDTDTPAAATTASETAAGVDHLTISQRVVDGGDVCDELFDGNEAVAAAFGQAAMSNGTPGITSIIDGRRSPGATTSPELDELMLSCPYGPITLEVILWEDGIDPVCGHPAACLPNRVGDLEYWDQFIEVGFDVDAGYGFWYTTGADGEPTPTAESTTLWMALLAT